MAKAKQSSKAASIPPSNPPSSQPDQVGQPAGLPHSPPAISEPKPKASPKPAVQHSRPMALADPAAPYLVEFRKLRFQYLRQVDQQLLLCLFRVKGDLERHLVEQTNRAAHRYRECLKQDYGHQEAMEKVKELICLDEGAVAPSRLGMHQLQEFLEEWDKGHAAGKAE